MVEKAKKINLDEMLSHIVHSLQTSTEGKAVYTMLIGAGFSYGVIPTAKQILQDAPDWLYKRRMSDPDENPLNKSDIWKEFWKNVAEHYPHENTNLPIEFNEDNYFPKDNSITNAYQFLMSGNCPGGLTTPVLRREFIRSLHKAAIKKNNPAHLYLACLLNHQRKESWKFNAAFCRTILTTNFDPLLQDALQLVNVLYYMSDRPEAMDHLQEDDHDAIHLVYTHGSMHRYLLLNATEEIQKGADNSIALKTHFERHGVIVMGYGGWNDATMKALAQATQFDGNLYWCTRRGDTLSENVNELLDKHAGCAYKVIIPDADQAMHQIFKILTDSELPELLNDPVALLIEQMKGLQIAESELSEPISIQVNADKVDIYLTKELGRVQSSYIDSFDLILDNTLNRLKLARSVFLDPEKYESKNTSKEEYLTIMAQALASKYIAQAWSLAANNKFDKAVDLLSVVIDMPDASTAQKIHAHLNRGVAYSAMDPPKTKEAITDYSFVINMPDTSPDLKARALVNRGIIYRVMDPPHTKEEIADYSAVIDMPDSPQEEIIDALFRRGSAYNKMDPPKTGNAIIDFSVIIDMPDAPSEYKAMALVNRGIIYGDMNPPNTEKAVADYSAVINMPDATPKQKAEALVNCGITYVKMDPSKSQESIDNFSAVINMPDTSSEHKARAIYNRGVAYIEMDPPKIQDAIADFSSIIDMYDAPQKMKENAHRGLGLVLFRYNNDLQSFIVHTTRAMELDSTNNENRYCFGLSNLFGDSPDKTIELCSPAVSECEILKEIDNELKFLEEKKSILPENSKSAYEKLIQILTQRKKQLELSA